MGTSGSYGGSGSGAWASARGKFDQIDDGPEASSGSGDGAGGAADDAAAAAAAAIADALWREDLELRNPTPSLLPLNSLVSRRHGSGGGGAGSSGSSRTGGRASGGGRRTSTALQRGGAALAAGHALKNRDAETLRELGLDLAELETLGPRAQCARILEAVIGDGTHPDDHALKEAAAQQLKEIVLNNLSPLDSVEGFIGTFIVEQGLVELGSQIKAGIIDSAGSVRKEGRLRRYVATRMRQVREEFGTSIPHREIQATVAKIGHEAIKFLRAGGATA